MTAERDEVLTILAELSGLHPEVRMGQWVGMFANIARGSTAESVYDAEDEELLPAMREFLAARRAEAGRILASTG
jgi:hypothetical protein